MRKGERDEREVRIELTPMIDVTFLILVFFLCTLSFKELERKFVTWLPTSEGIRTQSVPLTQTPEIVVELERGQERLPPEKRTAIYRSGTGGHVFGKAVLEQEAGAGLAAHRSPADLVTRIAEWLRAQQAVSPGLLKARIRVDPQVPSAHATAVLDALAMANFERVAWASPGRERMRRFGSATRQR